MDQAKEALNQAIKECNKEKIEKLVCEHRIGIWSLHIRTALNSGGFDFATFVMNFVPEYRRDNCKNDLAIILLNSSMLEKAIESNLAKVSTALVDTAAEENLDLLKRLLKLTTPCIENTHKLDEGGMRKLCECVWVSSEAIKNAAKSGKKDILLHLKEIGAPIDFGAIFAVIAKDNLAMFKLMEKHFPHRVKFDYLARYRWKSTFPSTFECFKYFHASGHMPTYSVYQSAMKCEPNNHKLLDWLKDVECPGTFEVHDIPKDFEYRIEYNLNPGDFPWLIKLFQSDDIPEAKIDNGILMTSLLGNSLAIIDILPDLISYEPLWKSGCAVKLFNFIGATEPNRATIEVIIEALSELSLDRCRVMIHELHLNDHAFASLYLRIIDEDEDDKQAYFVKIKTIVKEMREKVHWGYAFLRDLNRWIESEGSYCVGEIIDEVNSLWKKYEDVIPELAKESNKVKWKEIYDEREPWKDDVHEFLYDLKLW
uniref:Uncharacterized protein n=1 Tax=Pithovirus LCPAC404 TaxID=2506597 RepID=A0A481ZD52_9VIRU|nr:MAG: hypothetical protein LCPAC404_02900 [Pithovirus LCPAC404]